MELLDKMIARRNRLRSFVKSRRKVFVYNREIEHRIRCKELQRKYYQKLIEQSEYVPETTG